jgi:hypothetical protein
MKVVFTTNIDKYRTVEWPVFTDHVPRKGEFIYLLPIYDSYCKSQKIPNRLEVSTIKYVPFETASVYLFETVAMVELWFNETDFKLYNRDGKLLN